MAKIGTWGWGPEVRGTLGPRPLGPWDLRYQGLKVRGPKVRGPMGQGLMALESPGKPGEQLPAGCGGSSLVHHGDDGDAQVSRKLKET